MASVAWATQAGYFTYQARILDGGGSVPTGSLDVVFQILDPSQTCVLYTEESLSHAALPTTGVLSARIGSGQTFCASGCATTTLPTGNNPITSAAFPTTPTPNAGPLPNGMDQIFSNIPIGGATHIVGVAADGSGPCNYTPAGGDARVLLAFWSPAGAGTWTAVDSSGEVISNVPVASVAETLAGMTAAQSQDLALFGGSITGLSSNTLTVGDSLTSTGTITGGTLTSTGAITSTGGITAGGSITSNGISNTGAISTTGNIVTSSGYIQTGGFAGASPPSPSNGAIWLNTTTNQINYYDNTGSLQTLPTGTSASASYVQKSGDTMTGALNLPSNGLAVGTSQLVVSGGNVGIGTASPSQLLDVRGSAQFKGSASTNLVLDAGGGNVAQVLFRQNGSDEMRLQLDNSNNLNFYDNNKSGGAGTEVTIQSVSGNVGIGTSTPSAILSVQSASTGTLKIASDIKDSSANKTALAFRLGTGRADILSSYYGTAENVDLTFTPTTSAGVQNEAMRIQASSGNVGIGTSSPASILNVTRAPASSANSGSVSFGEGAWDGTSAGHFAGNAAGTELAINAASTYTGDLANFEVGGVSMFKVDASGNVTEAGAVTNSGSTTDTGSVNINTSGAGITTIGGGGGVVNIGTSGSESVILGSSSNSTALSGSAVTINSSGSGTTTIGAGSGSVSISGGTGNTAIGNTTGTTTLTGATTLSSSTTVSGASANSVLFTNASSDVATDNAKLSWNDTSGQFGVGTSSPQAIFQVSDSAQSSSIPALGAHTNTQFDLTNSDVTYGLLEGVLQNGNAWMQAQRTDGTATAYNMLLQPNGGNLGIGTTNPVEQVQVSGAGSQASPGTLAVTGTDTTNGESRILLSQTPGGSDLQILNAGADTRTDGRVANDQYIEAEQRLHLTSRGDGTASNVEVQLGVSGVGSYTDMAFYTGAVGSAGTEQMRIDGNGHVGIGTSSPASTLNVTRAPASTANTGSVSIGEGAWDGSTSGHFVGNAAGTELAVNAASTYAGDLANFEVGGVSKFKVDASGNVTEAGTVTSSGSTNETGTVNINQTGGGVTTIGEGGGGVTIGDTTGGTTTLQGTLSQTGVVSINASGTGSTSIGTGSTAGVTIGDTSGGTTTIQGATSLTGATTLSSSTTLSGASANSVLFTNASSDVATDNAKLSWNDTSGELGIGTASPGALLDVAGTTSSGNGGALIETTTSGSGNNVALAAKDNYSGSSAHARSIYGQNPAASGTGTTTVAEAMYLDNASGGTSANSSLSIGGSPTSGNYSIYDASTNQSYFAGKVGIGTTSPSDALSINGSLSLAGAISDYHAATDPASPQDSAYFEYDITDNSDTSTYWGGVQTEPIMYGSETNINGLYAIGAWPSYQGTGSMNSLYGVDASVGVTSGTINTDAAALSAATNVSGTGNVNQLSGIHVSAATHSGSGVVTNNYGILIGDETIGTQNFAIKTGKGLVSFGDDVGIGTTAPASTLNVTRAPASTANAGSVSIGEGAWDGSTSGHFSGNAAGTELAVNAASSYTGDLANFEVGGTSKFKVDASGNITESGAVNSSGGETQTGAININQTGTGVTTIGEGGGGVTIGASGGTTTLQGTTNETGTVNINSSGTAGTSIGTGSTGGVTIGDTSGGTTTIQGATTLTGATTLSTTTTVSGTSANSVLFTNSSNDVATDNAKLSWDDSSGELGIGVTSPGYPLDVETPSTLGANVDALTISGVNASSETLNTTVGMNFNLTVPGSPQAWTYAAIRGGEDSGTGQIMGSLRFFTQKYSAGSHLNEAMRIDHDGNVGIGTASPAGTLDVRGGTASSGAGVPIILSAQQGAASSNGGNIILNAGPNGSSASNGYIAFGTGSSFTGNDLTTERMRIDPSGNVGIGTTNPGYALDVHSSTGNVVGAVESTSGSGYIYTGSSGTNNTGMYFLLAGAGEGSVILNGTDNSVRIQTNSSGYQDRMTIQNGGNVGIGTTSPAEKLDVNGSIAVKGTPIQTAQSGSFVGAVPSGCYDSSECNVAWSVTFPHAFVSTPTVVLNSGSCGGSGRALASTFYTTPTTTGFSVSYAYKINGDWSGNCTIVWIAVGQM